MDLGIPYFHGIHAVKERYDWVADARDGGAGVGNCRTMRPN